MVGGRVIEVIVVPQEIWLNVRDKTYTKDTCAVFVERNEDSERIAVGDSVWWQGGYIYWTPASREFSDRKIPRTSASGVNRPEGHDILDQDVICFS